MEKTIDGVEIIIEAKQYTSDSDDNEKHLGRVQEIQHDAVEGRGFANVDLLHRASHTYERLSISHFTHAPKE